MAGSSRPPARRGKADRPKRQGRQPGDAGKQGASHDTPLDGIDEREIEDIEDRSSPRAPIIYEIVRRLGEEELARPVTSLWWSGVAAGLSISVSLLAQAILEMHLPDEPWRPLVSSFGYSAGFLIVVLGRQQLFTENTITMVLPLMVEFSRTLLLRVLGIWGIVLLANLVGTLAAALFLSFTPVVSADLLQAMLHVASSGVAEHGWWAMLVKGVVSGFLIAAMVWLIPSADETQFHVITLMTYLIAVGGFTHIVAGSVDAFMLVVAGQLGAFDMAVDFALPVFIGNVVGGTALFAMISYAQVMAEI
jgi:formate/nitrite transporter FocA (FNT family)